VFTPLAVLCLQAFALVTALSLLPQFVVAVKGCISKYAGSVWEERVNAAPKFYGDIHNRLTDFLSAQKGLTIEPEDDEDDTCKPPLFKTC
jgi:hypothetical protein